MNPFLLRHCRRLLLASLLLLSSVCHMAAQTLDGCGSFQINVAAGIDPSLLPFDIIVNAGDPSNPTGTGYSIPFSVTSSTGLSVSQSVGSGDQILGFAVLGVLVPSDGQPHKIPTADPTKCLEAKVVLNGFGCPTLTVRQIPCCEKTTVIYGASVDNVRIIYADGTNLYLPQTSSTPTAEFPNGGKEVTGITLTEANDVMFVPVGDWAYRRQYGTSGAYCVKYFVSRDASTGCVTVNVQTVPCPDPCPGYHLITSLGCEDGSFALYLSVAGDAMSSVDNHLITGPMDIMRPGFPGWGFVHSVAVGGVDIPIDGKPHRYDIAGSNGHRYIKTTVVRDPHTLCVTITIECVYDPG